MQARAAATELKEFPRHYYFIQNIVEIMHKRMRFNLSRLVADVENISEVSVIK